MKVLHIIFLIFSALIAFLTYKTVKVSSLDLLLGILQNISVMIFTIMGIWIAYLYPNAIVKITKPSTEVENAFPDNDYERIKTLVGIILASAFVLGALLIFSTFRMLLQGSDLYMVYRDFFKFIGVMYIVLLSYIQILAVYLVMASNFNFLVDLKNKRSQQKRSNKF